jgi:hypothetical protein
MKIFVGLIFVAVVSLSAPALSQETYTDEQLMNGYRQADSNCRGGPGNTPETEDWCAMREAVASMLQHRGWCYGTKAQTGYQRKWRRCRQ